MRKRHFAMSVLFIFMQLNLCRTSAALPESDYSAKKNATYPLVENLISKGQVILIKPDTYPRRGEWNKEGFFAFEEDENARIKIVEDIGSQGLPQTMLHVSLQHANRYRLTFDQVPSGARMLLYFRVQDNTPMANAKNKEVVSAYIKVLVGQQLIDRIRVTDEDGWYRVPVELGVIRFLKRPIALDFDVSSDRNNVDFAFYGDVVK